MKRGHRQDGIAWYLICLKMAGDAQTAKKAATPAAAPGSGPQAPATRRHNRIAWYLIGLKMMGDVLRSRQFQKLTGVGAIMLAALALQARENEAQILARLIAWDKQQRLRLERHLDPASRRTRNAGSPHPAGTRLIATGRPR